MLRAGLEPATVRLGVDNRTRSGPQQFVRRGRGVRSVAESNRNGQARAWDRPYQEITEPLRPATICRSPVPDFSLAPAYISSRSARDRTRTSEVGARRATGYTTDL